MKSIWQGIVSFGLVSIPVKLYSAVNPRSISFKLFHEADNGRIQYRRFCSKEGKEVDYQEIVKGIETGKNKFYLLSKKELKEIKPEKSEFINVQEFVSLAKVDLFFLNNHYFIGPTRSKDKAYFLFKDALETSGKAAVAKFIFKEKEHLALIYPYKTGLVLSTLNYLYEIRDIKQIEELGDKPVLSENEKKLAKQLIDQLSKPKFNISMYEDTFEVQLRQLIEKKKKGEPITIAKPSITREEDLMAALKASLEA